MVWHSFPIGRFCGWEYGIKCCSRDTGPTQFRSMYKSYQRKLGFGKWVNYSFIVLRIESASLSNNACALSVKRERLIVRGP
jgi:hypothetical protein